jgi:hypothetical protein
MSSSFVTVNLKQISTVTSMDKISSDGNHHLPNLVCLLPASCSSCASPSFVLLSYSCSSSSSSLSTTLGRSQCTTGASNIKQYLRSAHLTLELILVSPLYRTMETSTIIFEEQILVDNVTLLASPLATEEVTGSDDIGDTPTAIREKWSKNKVGKNCVWAEFPETPEVWYWTPPQYEGTSFLPSLFSVFSSDNLIPIIQ